MSKTSGGILPPTINLERASSQPLYRQLYDAIRQAILQGTLRKGLRLPSTRSIANELHVSRNIVIIAFEQLLAEGYIESRTGAGTFVTKTLPDEVLQLESVRANGNRALSARGKMWQRLPKIPFPAADPKLRYAPFRYGLPALDELPLDLWGDYWLNIAERLRLKSRFMEMRRDFEDYAKPLCLMWERRAA